MVRSHPLIPQTSSISGEEHSSPAAAIIACLSFSHDPLHKVLEDVSLTVNQGDFLALIGPNGGGKTTLLRLLLGLLQPQSGTISVFGRSPASMSKHIGYVPQFSTMELDFPASVLDMTLMGAACPTLRGGAWSTGSAARKKALGYLDLLGLGGLEKQHVGALSGGQRQRALVARALMGSPEPLEETASTTAPPAPFLLLLDEPTASIDPEGTFCFFEFLGKLRGRITVIVVSHDLFMVSPFFSSVAFVNKNLTTLDGSALSPENLNVLFGQHLHNCPVADMQHAGGATHEQNCTHPVCQQNENGPSEDRAHPPDRVSSALGRTGNY